MVSKVNKNGRKNKGCAVVFILSGGTFPIRELIDWFGIAPDTYYSHKESYLKLLKNYCKYKISEDGKQITIG